MKILQFSSNPFGGVILSSQDIPVDSGDFLNSMKFSISQWEKQNFKVVWLELDLKRVDLVPIAIHLGFEFHHCTSEYLQLTYSIVKDSFIPPYASHYIGAGGVVINQQNELLVVVENRGNIPDALPSYKLPGGTIKEGEYISEGVVREVLEETGIDTKFESIVCFRNLHGYRFAKSDIYFVCRLTPKNSKIVIQTEEIEESIWMPISQYLSDDRVSLFNKRIVEDTIKSKGLSIEIIDGNRSPEQQEAFMPVLE